MKSYSPGDHACNVMHRDAIRLEADELIIHKRRTAREVMRQALTESPAPSVQEIAKRLRYKSIGSLKRVSAQLYLKIAERHRVTVARESAIEGCRAEPSRNKDEVRSALEAALSAGPHSRFMTWRKNSVTRRTMADYQRRSRSYVSLW